MHREQLLSIREASDWASSHLGKNVTPSNISYLIQYDDELHSVIKGVQWALEDAFYEAYGTVFGNLPSTDDDYFYNDKDDEYAELESDDAK
jgi:hypothetical protein